MIAELPTPILTLIRAHGGNRSATTPSPTDQTLTTSRRTTTGETMRALVDAGKKAGYSSDIIADALDRRITRYIETVGHRGHGERNATAYRIARWLVNDFGTSEAVAAAYLAGWNHGNHPPLPPNELTAILRSAVRNGARPAGCAHVDRPTPRGAA